MLDLRPGPLSWIEDVEAEDPTFLRNGQEQQIIAGYRTFYFGNIEIW
jgi:hypothetical protein